MSAQPTTATPTTLEDQAIAVVRGLSMDAPMKAKSGHQGTAMTLAPLANVLFNRIMKHDPADPYWPDRDRFILSNGHASILLYSYLFLAGYGLTMADLKAFRQWDSRTPGHPEARHTTGVEVTTGPLGQGFANAVGMAIAESHLRARFGADVIDHHVFVIAGDGCFMEGISHESASLAGHLALGRLVCVFDDNHITIDGSTSLSNSDDVAGRFRAYGWDVDEVGEIGEDLDALEAAIRRAMAVADKPSLIVLRSHIAEPSPDWRDRHEAHANPFDAETIGRTKAILGIPDEPFYAPTDWVEPYRRGMAERGSEARAAWQKRFDTWAAQNESNGDEWDAAWQGGGLAGWDANLPTWPIGDKPIATRVALAKVLSACETTIPGLLSGAADLTGNTGVKLDGAMAYDASHPEGTQIHYGIREHAMGSALNGMAMHGGVLPVGGTFFVFADYMRPSLRLAAISRAHSIFVFSHDSVGVGEDGPTHQPIEQLMSLRLIPGLQVIRPADANETAAAWRAAVAHDGPTALILSRQAVPNVTDGTAVEIGAGVVKPVDAPRVVLVATGSEVGLCVEAAGVLDAAGIATSVVSMPSWDRFAHQSSDVRHHILPPGVPTLSVEAGSTLGWDRWADDCIGIDVFGASAPGDVVLDHLGINVDNVVTRAKALAAATPRDQNGAS